MYTIYFDWCKSKSMFRRLGASSVFNLRGLAHKGETILPSPELAKMLEVECSYYITELVVKFVCPG